MALFNSQVILGFRLCCFHFLFRLTRAKSQQLIVECKTLYFWLREATNHMKSNQMLVYWKKKTGVLLLKEKPLGVLE